MIHQIPSPNFGPRKHGRGPDMVVIHYTAMESAKAAIERLCDPKPEVSAHFVICKTGKITQLVDTQHRAWHAGAGSWGNVVDVNSHSIGIELDFLEGSFPKPQIAALVSLLTDLLVAYEISPSRVIGHSDMAPGRKFDPGGNFPWNHLAKKKLSIWPRNIDPHDPDWDEFLAAAQIFGYPMIEDKEALLDAFRMRFLPKAVGDLSPLDMGVVKTLAEKFPCQFVDLGDAIT